MPSKFSRRDFLKFGTVAAGGTVVATYIGLPSVAAKDALGTAQFEGVTLVVMYPDGEFPQEYRDQVKNEMGIDIEFLQEDLNRLTAMWAAGEAPDIWRANALQIGPHVVRNQVLGLNDYVDASELIKWDDLQPAAKQHMFDGVVRGSGTLYGLPKDWGTDFLVFCYTDAFAEAGVDVPSPDSPMSYDEFFALAAQLTKSEGDRTLRWGGTSHYWENGPGPQFLLEILPQIAGAEALYSDDFSSVNLSNNPAVAEVFNKWLEAAKAHIAPSVIDPMPSWFGQVFTQGTLGMAQAGYWYGAQAESDITRDKVVVLPAPYWVSPETRTDSSVWATATVGSSRTANPDATWKVIEYYSGGQPAIDRALQGWGVPLLKSMFDMLPQDTPYNQQRYAILASELAVAERALGYNPYVSEFTEAASLIQQALEGSISAEDALSQMESATNEAIRDTIDRLA